MITPAVSDWGPGPPQQTPFLQAKQGEAITTVTELSFDYGHVPKPKESCVSLFGAKLFPP